MEEYGNGKLIFGDMDSDYEYWIPQQGTYKDFAIVRLLRNAEKIITGAEIIYFPTKGGDVDARLSA